VSWETLKTRPGPHPRQQISTRLGKRQDLAAQLIEAQQAQLASKGLPDQIASSPSGHTAQAVEQPLESAVKADGDGISHIMQCITDAAPAHLNEIDRNILLSFAVLLRLVHIFQFLLQGVQAIIECI